MLLRPGQTITHALAQVPALESALDARPRAVRIEEDPTMARRVQLRVLERDPHATPLPWPGPQGRSITRPLLLGVYESGERTRVLLWPRHTLIAGTTGSGKSGVVNLVVAELVAAPDVIVWGIDFKAGLELGPWAPCLDQLATTPDHAEQLLTAAVAILEARARQLAARGRQWHPTPTTPALVIVVDEQAELADQAPAALGLQDSIARRGRAVGVLLVVASQRATQDALGSDVLRQQVGVRICLRMEEIRDTDVVLGSGATRQGWDATRLDLPGKLLVRAPTQGLTLPRRARAWQVTDTDVAATVTRHARQRRPLDPLSVATAQPHLLATGSAGPTPPPAAPPGESPVGPAAGTHPAPGSSPVSPARPDPTLTLRQALQAAGSRGVHIGELITRTGMRRTWVYEQLAALARAGRAEQVTRLDLASARAHVHALAEDRRARGRIVSTDQIEAAAALLVDLWAAAYRYGISPTDHGWTTHLPRAALATATAARKQRRHGHRAKAHSGGQHG